MKREDWRHSNRVEIQYAHDMYEILRKFFSEASTASRTVLSDWLDLYSVRAAQRMVTGLYRQNERTWRQAATVAMRSRVVYTAMQQELANSPVGIRFDSIIHRNAELIRTLPYKVSEQVTAKVAQQTQAGQRAENINLGSLAAKLSRSHVRLIARTETGKASTALTRARAEDLNLGWYIWETSRDQRVRLSHKMMSGALFNWNDPPSPEVLAGEKSEGHYAPADIFNCRCYPAPLLRLDQTGWPHRVYYGGRIQVMNLSVFRRISNFESLAA